MMGGEDWRREKAQGSKKEEGGGGGVIDKKMVMGSIECDDTPLLSYSILSYVVKEERENDGRWIACAAEICWWD